MNERARARSAWKAARLLLLLLRRRRRLVKDANLKGDIMTGYHGRDQACTGASRHSSTHSRA